MIIVRKLFKHPERSLGIMNVWVLLPLSKVMMAFIYVTRSVLLPTTHAATGLFVDRDFEAFVKKHLGVTLVKLPFLKFLYGIFTSFRYAPIMPIHRKLRNKEHTKNAVRAGKIKGVTLPPNTQMHKAKELLARYSNTNNLPKKKTVFQQAEGDGGYGTLIYIPGKNEHDLIAMLSSVSGKTTIIVADFANNLTHIAGIPMLPDRVAPPNANLTFTDSPDTVGVSAPMMDVLNHKAWVQTAMRAGEHVRQFVMAHIYWGYFTMGVDLGITNHGSTDTYFFEINPRMTMSHLVTSGIWKACQHKGTTKLSFYDFLEGMNTGKLGMAYIAVDKVQTGGRTFKEIQRALESAGIKPFDGKTGWLPTRQQVDGKIGLIVIDTQVDAHTALRHAKTMYLRCLAALGTKPQGELEKLGF